MASAYREYSPPPAWAALVACLWEHAATERHVQRVIPDACLDLIWSDTGGLVIAGADTGPRFVALAPGAHLTGLRLRPGAAGGVLGISAAELCDAEVDVVHVWGEQAERLTESLARAAPGDRRTLLAAAVMSRPAEPDPLVTAAATRLSAPDARVAAVAATLGVTERTLHRRTLSAIGYGPKMLARVARLRRLMAGEGDLAGRAYAAGYASQAHMTEEVRRLTGTTPVRFLKDAQRTAA
jgi:AraC-like DNA-binding protein